MVGEQFTNPTKLPHLPDGWRRAAIEELCTKVTSGGTPLRSVERFFRDGTHSWFKTQELRDRVLWESEEKITDEALKESSAKLLPKDTVLMAMYGDGKTITSLGLLAAEAACNQACCAMIPDQTVCIPRFLFYALKNHRDDFIRIATGGAQRNLSGTLIRRFALNTPSPAEQIAIAQTLGTLDEKIELNRRMNETLESMARALFRSWFIEFDPVRAKAEKRDPGLSRTLADLFASSFEQSEVGDIPKNWKVVGLDEIGRFLNGLALQKFPPQGDRFLPVIKIAQLRTEDTSDADKASADLAPEYVVKDGDVLFSWSGSLECILWAGGQGALNQHLFKVTSERYPKWFYFLWIGEHLEEFRHIAAGKATTMGHIQRGHLSAAKVLIPPAELLNEMSHHFAPLINQIVQLKVASKTLATIRDALLPKLISGDLRVPDVERIVGGQT